MFYHNKIERQKRNIYNIFKLRYDLFFNKKKITKKEFGYRFDVHDPFDVLPELNGLEYFRLVGDNWITADGRNKPLALMIGFNNWKLGFISAYCPEYRTAYFPRKISAVRMKSRLIRLKERPAAFIVWGKNAPLTIELYAWIWRIPLYRIEDGFIRSAELGAAYATPYSLVLDKRSIYFDGTQSSDLEVMLNTSHPEENEPLMMQARHCLAVIRENNLSKYNPPEYPQAAHFPAKTRKRVLVIGQVEKDMSLKYGNPDRWTWKQLVQLATYEHPDADILFRPHPEMYKYFQNNKKSTEEIRKYVEIVSSQSPLPDMLATIDHVYTISSLSGIEAVFRGIKTTVVGIPFYAGWGLTDDRAKIARRNRVYGIEAFFAVAYVQYPRYILAPDDNYTGLLAACLKINADRHILAHDLMESKKGTSVAHARRIAQSPYWPKLLLDTELQRDYLESYVDIGAVYAYFPCDGSARAQTLLAYAMCGATSNDTDCGHVLALIRERLYPEVMNALLCDLSAMRPGMYLLPHITWLLSRNKEMDEVERVLQLHMRKPRTAADSDDVSEQKHLRINVIRRLFAEQITHKKFTAALDSARLLLLSGDNILDVLLKGGHILEMVYDIAGARVVYGFVRSSNRIRGNYKAANRLLATSIPEHGYSGDAIMTLALEVFAMQPNKLQNIQMILRSYEDYIDSKRYEALLLTAIHADDDCTVQKAAAYLALERPEKAVSVLEHIIRAEKNDSEDVCIAYSQALSFSERLDEATAVIDVALTHSRTSGYYAEALRLCVLSGDYAKGMALLHDAGAQGIVVGDMIRRKIYFGARRLKEALQTFCDIPVAGMVADYYPGKYYVHGETPPGASITVLGSFGPGDEVRYAKLYTVIADILPHREIYIACDPRFYAIFSRSFPQMHFIPCKRLRHNERYNVEDYNMLPGAELSGILDNNGVASINATDNVVVGMDLLHHAYPDYYHAEPNNGFLQCNDDAKEVCQRRLAGVAAHTMLVGISWRSSIVSHARNEHYVTVEELAPVFALEGVTFVNLQYDECSEELAYVDEHFPGKMIHLPDIDQYNDFDTVSGLMCALDVVIAPCTTVAEIAGALGCPTWFISNSSETHWRKIDERKRDLWYNNMRHIEGQAPLDKKSLVQELAQALREEVSRRASN